MCVCARTNMHTQTHCSIIKEVTGVSRHIGLDVVVKGRWSEQPGSWQRGLGRDKRAGSACQLTVSAHGVAPGTMWDRACGELCTELAWRARGQCRGLGGVALRAR